MMRSVRLPVLLAAALVVGCSETPTDPQQFENPAMSIVDAGNDGISGFYFLPPMVKAQSYSGVFDASQEPVVSICQETATGCTSVAEFTRSNGITVDAVDEHYMAVWHTPDNVNATYRVTVSLHELELGHADVKTGRRASDLKGVDKSQFVTLVAGQTLPIKFRLEENVVQCEPQLTVSGNNLTLELRAGTIPYNPQTDAAGFFKGVPVLFAGGLAYGTNADDYVLGLETATGASDFDPNVPICLLRTPTLVYSRVEPVVLKADGPTLSVVQESYAFQNAPDDDYVLLRYTFTNTGSATVSGLRVGLNFDWDVYFSGAPNDYFNDVVRWLPGIDAGYIGEIDSSLGLAGIASDVSLTSYTGYNNGSEGPAATRRATVWGFLSNGVNATPFGPNDVRQIGSVGPVDIAAGASRTFTFILSGGDNLSDFEANVIQARVRAATID